MCRTAALLVAYLTVASHVLPVSSWSYISSRHPLPWQRARDFCQWRGGDLVHITSLEQNVFINRLFPLKTQYYWIGFHWNGKDWAWLDHGPTVDNSTVQSENNDLVFQQGTGMKQQGLFVNWANGEPNNMKQNEGCAEMYVQRENETGKWNDEPCAKRKFALCALSSCKIGICNKWSKCQEEVDGASCTGSCPHPHPPSGGSIKCSFDIGQQESAEHLESGSWCEIRCEHEKNLVFNISCLDNGTWNGTEPHCKGSCPHPHPPSGGSIKCSFDIGQQKSAEHLESGSWCEIRCEHEKNVVFNMSCLDNGTWNGTEPHCKGGQRNVTWLSSWGKVVGGVSAGVISLAAIYTIATHLLRRRKNEDHMQLTRNSASMGNMDYL